MRIKCRNREGILRRNDPIFVYCLFSSCALLLLIIKFALSRGELLSSYFFYDTRDTGMDFFHSIEYIRERAPYTKFHVLYPPLANLFFLICYIFIPESVAGKWADTFKDSISNRGTDADLRTYQSCLILFVFIIVLFALLLGLMIRSILRGKAKYKEWLIFCIFFSYPVMISVERGNIIIYAFLLSLFFVEYHDSDNKFLKELSLIALAFAFGLKLYPAVFGLLLIRNKDYKAAVRCVIYGILSIIFPLFFFRESPIDALTAWFKVLSSIGTNSSTTPWIGTGFSNIVYNVEHIVSYLSGTEFVASYSRWITYILVAILAVLCCLSKSKWQGSLIAFLIIVFFSSQGNYVYIFMIIPLLMFLKEEESLNSSNWFPFYLLALTTLPIPLFRSKTAVIPTRNIFMQSLLILLLVYTIYSFITTLIRSKKGGVIRIKQSGSRFAIYSAITVAISAFGWFFTY